MATQSSKTVTVRLPAALYSQVLKVAEETNSNLAEATRNCLSYHFNQVSINERLNEINQSLSRLEKSVGELAVE